MASSAVRLSKEMVSREPVRMVLSPPCISNGFRVATLELSNADLLQDYYCSVLLVFDVQASLQQEPPLSVPHDEPAARLHHALEELLLYCPSAAGLVVPNEINGRLEVKYPVPNTSSAEFGPHACTDLNLAHQLVPSDIQYPSRPSICQGSMITHNDKQSSSRYGVQFHVAHADVTLSDLGDVSDPQPCLDLLYPSMQSTQGLGGSKWDPLDRYIMAFQLTVFKCRGFTLAHTCSHLYADGYAAATFLQNLCSIARGAGLANPADYSRSRRVTLSPREPPLPTMPYTFIGTRKQSADQPRMPSKHLQWGTATRFVLSMDALETLRLCGSKPDDSKTCSRYQALMALLFMAYARVRVKVHGLPGSHEVTLRFPMNLRTRGVPNVTPSFMGNAFFLCNLCATLEELSQSPLGYVVAKIKNALRNVDFVEVFQSVIDDIELKLRDGLVPFIEAAHIAVVSLVGLPFYDTDCGWDRPTYVGRPSQQMSNRCFILEHPAAQAWNVLVVFASVEERACFEETIADYITPIKR